MTLILSGTNGLSDVDGDASTPAVRGTDANSGIFFGADTVGVSTNGVERVEFGNSETVFNDGGANLDFRVEGDTEANLLFVDASTDRVGIGTNAPGTVLNVVGTTGIRIRGANINSDGALELKANNTSCIINSATFGSSVPLVFQVDNTERMRIDSSGNLLVGTTSGSTNTFLKSINSTPSLTVRNGLSSGTLYGINANFSAAAPNDTVSFFLQCNDTGAERATIRSNGGIANYSANDVNLSDRREKTNFAPAKNYLNTICAIPVQTFNYVDQNLEEDDGLTLGVVAQDVQEVAPELVMESNWGTQEEPKMRLSIYQTDLQYALMKCIQELKAELDTVKAELATLKG